jgi:hypothetical protein
MSDWQTMDSAPKDATRFLAFENGNQYVCKWGDWYLARTGANGKREDVYGWIPAGAQPGAQAHPTHWMPLPEGPDVAVARAEKRRHDTWEWEGKSPS